MTHEILIATHNLHKSREIRNILSDLKGFELLTLNQFPAYQPPEEHGESFSENARLKAVDAATKLGMTALADDSGLVVPAIGGEPGIHSARYASQPTERDRRRALLTRMAGLEEEQRYAYFVCAIALAMPDGRVFVEEAKCEGTLLTAERGGNGHGYDPLFVKHGYARTFGELDEATKNRISHRRKALDRMRLHLETLSLSSA